MKTEDLLPTLEHLAAGRPRDPDSWQDLALALAASGKLHEAFEANCRALTESPDHAEALVTRSCLHHELGREAEALRGLERVHARAPDDPHVLTALGNLLFRTQRREAGAAQLGRVAQLRPNLPYALLNHAAALEQLGQREEALRQLFRARQAIEGTGLSELVTGLPSRVEGLVPPTEWADPALARLPALVARLAGGQGAPDVVERQLVAACRKLPGHEVLTLELARQLVAAGRGGEAKRWLQALARLDPELPSAHSELAFLHAELGELELASASLRTATRLRPLETRFHQDLGVILLDLGRSDEAMEELRLALLLEPGAAYSTLHLASAMLRRGASTVVLEILTASDCAAWPEAQLLQAEAEVRLGNRASALAALQKVLAVDPCNVRALEIERELSPGTVLSTAGPG